MALSLPIALATAVIVALVLFGPGYGQDLRLERASVSSGGSEANAASMFASLSADGRYVAFASDATNLTPGVTGRNIYVHDRLTGATELASVSSSGAPANSLGAFPSAGVSGDGRYVVFQSDASDLVVDDTNAAPDVFLHDRVTGATTRVSISSDGAQGDAESATPSISADGRYIAFTSLASNLVADDTNNGRDVFVRDLVAGTTELASVGTDGTHGNFTSGGLGGGPPKISNDGRYVVFGSFADNLVPNDTNSRDDIFLRDRLMGTTERVSVATDGTEGNGHSLYGSVSDDGRYAVYYSDASNLVGDDTNGVSDIFLRDTVQHVTTRLSEGPGGAQPNGPSQFAVISGDGSRVAFQSAAANLVSGDTNSVLDIFIYHMAGEFIERVSVPDGGGQANGASAFAAISRDGEVLAFHSDATNLVAGDTNGATDVFVYAKALGPAPTTTPTPRPTTATPTPRPPTPTPTPGCGTRIGDVNNDHQANSIDAALILQYGAGLLTSISPNGDVNGDRRIDAVDAALVLQFTAGLLSCLPPP